MKAFYLIFDFYLPFSFSFGGWLFCVLQRKLLTFVARLVTNVMCVCVACMCMCVSRVRT